MPSLFTFLNLLQAYKHLKLLSTGSDLLDGGTILLPEIVTVYWPLGSQSGHSDFGITPTARAAAE
jgi:hypothetical protein